MKTIARKKIENFLGEASVSLIFFTYCPIPMVFPMPAIISESPFFVLSKINRLIRPIAVSTASNTFLTLISAFQHQDRKTLGEVFPLVKHEQFKRLSSAEMRSKMLDFAKKSIVCRIRVENKPPKESDICAIYTSDSPENEINQAWSFGYVDGAWRFTGSTSEIDSWLPQARNVEALIRSMLGREKQK